MTECSQCKSRNLRLIENSGGVAVVQCNSCGSRTTVVATTPAVRASGAIRPAGE